MSDVLTVSAGKGRKKGTAEHIAGQTLPTQYPVYCAVKRCFDIGFALTAGLLLMLPLKLLFLAGTAVFAFALHRRGSYFRSDLNLGSRDRYQMLLVSLGYMMALCMAMLGYVFPYVDRVGWYFYLFEGVYLGMLLKGKNPVNRLIFGYFIAFVIGYGFLYSMTNNSQGTMPYSVFW